MFALSLGKFVTPVVQFNKKDARWQYVTKFAMGVGTGTWKLRAKFTKPINKDSNQDVKIRLNIYIDDNWEMALDGDNCHDKLRASKRETIIRVPENGEISEEYIGSLTQKSRPHVWFFTISD